MAKQEKNTEQKATQSFWSKFTNVVSQGINSITNALFSIFRRNKTTSSLTNNMDVASNHITPKKADKDVDNLIADITKENSLKMDQIISEDKSAKKLQNTTNNLFKQLANNDKNKSSTPKDRYELRRQLLTNKLEQLDKIKNPNEEIIKTRNKLVSVLTKVEAMQKHNATAPAAKYHIPNNKFNKKEGPSR